jgi:hypothetical protein
VDAIHELAAQIGQTPQQIASALANNPSRWLKQVAAARNPRAETIEHVRLLLSGQAVRRRARKVPVTQAIMSGAPAAATSPATAAQGVALSVTERTKRHCSIVPRHFPGGGRPQAASREPCPRCATRGDVGCAHQSPYQEELLVHER